MSRTNTNFSFSVGVFIVIAALIALIYSGMSSVLRGPVADMSAEAVAERIAPVAKLNTGEAIMPVVAEAVPAAAAAPRSGEQVYKSACFACHDTGAAGAPKIGSADWSPRIGQGMDTLMKHALNGFKAMPPRGTCGNCSDEEIRNAVEFIVTAAK